MITIEQILSLSKSKYSEETYKELCVYVRSTYCQIWQKTIYEHHEEKDQKCET